MTRVEQTGTWLQDKRADFGWNEVGQLTSVDRYEDLAGTDLVASTSYQFDGRGRLESLEHEDSASATIAEYTLGYDILDRVTSIDSTNFDVSYEYDAQHQLVDEDYTSGPVSDQEYEYDEAGNRAMSGYVMGPNNRLLEDPTYTYAYTKEGNLTLRTHKSTGDTTEYVWDHRNRLTEVIERDDEETVLTRITYSYLWSCPAGLGEKEGNGWGLGLGCGAWESHG